MSGIIIALIAGLLMSVQGVWNTRVTEASNLWVSNTIVHGSGLILCLIIWFVTGKPSFADAFTIKNKYYLLGGIVGALIVYAVIKSISSLGPAVAVMLILISQLTTAYLIELFGLFETETVSFDFKKLIGVVIMIIGIIIFKI